jgi:predicted RNase H-like HicB family nuclease
VEVIIMKQVYPVIFTQLDDKKHTVLIEVPDLEILTEGFGMPNAIEMARDAIGLKVITMEDQKEKIPNPRMIKEIDALQGTFAQEGEGLVSMVDVDFAEYRRRMDNKTVRRNVTLPNWLNQEAEKAHINVSGVLQEALMLKLGVHR